MDSYGHARVIEKILQREREMQKTRKVENLLPSALTEASEGCIVCGVAQTCAAHPQQGNTKEQRV